MSSNKNIQSIANITYLISMFLFLFSVIVNASEYIPQSTEVTNNSKLHEVEIIIDSDDHPHFSDIKRRCSYYWPYFKGKIKKPDGLILEKSECLQYADLLTLSKGYAPLGVFFRSKIKNNQSEVHSYHWEIVGPIINSPIPLLAKFDSFNASMIFEKAGKYHVILKVIFNDGTQAKDHVTVTVWPRDGKTYFVDSRIGSDHFNGLSMVPDRKCISEKESNNECYGPWKSATRSFAVLASQNPHKRITLMPGDQILFRRGQTFDLKTDLSDITKQKYTIVTQRLKCTPQVSVDHWSKILGIHFGPYGRGTIPLIKNIGNTSCFVFDFPGVGLMHLSFQDLAFNLESSNSPPHDNRASFLFAIGQPINLILNRISLKRFNQGLLFHNAHGVFINQSNLFDAKVGMLYSETATDVAFLNNKFDYSGNHIAYTNISHALVTGNTFSRIAFGRTALRVFGSDQKHLTESIWISDNHFEGWIDPRTRDDCESASRCQYADGKRYNWSLVELHPNVPDEDRFMKNIVFKRNIVRNAETLLRIGATHNLLVENNIFDTLDNSGSARIKLHSSFSRRPLENVIFRNNLFLERSRDRTHQSPIIELSEYTNEFEHHKRLSIINNHFVNSNNCIVKLKNFQTKKGECLLNSSNNKIFINKSSPPYITFSQNKANKLKTEILIKKINDKMKKSF